MIDDEIIKTELINYSYIMNFSLDAKEQAKKIHSKVLNKTFGKIYGICYIEELIEWSSDFFSELNMEFIEPSISKK